MRRRPASSAIRPHAFHPEGIRRFATWTPLLIPFYIPRGAAWDTAWSGAERLRAANMPFPLPILQLIGFYAGAALLAGIVLDDDRAALGPSRPGDRAGAALRAQGRAGTAWPIRIVRTALCGLLCRRTDAALPRSRAWCAAGRVSMWTRRITDPLQLRGSFFYLCDAAQQTAWSLGFEPVQIGKRRLCGFAAGAEPDQARKPHAGHRRRGRSHAGGRCADCDLALASDGLVRPRAAFASDELPGTCIARARLLRARSRFQCDARTDLVFEAAPTPSSAATVLLRDKKTGRMSHEIFFHAGLCEKRRWARFRL